MTLRDQGITDPKRWAKENNVDTAPPLNKHRYFFTCGSSRQKRKMMQTLRYPVVAEYPKLPKATYDAGPRVEVYIEDPEVTWSHLV
jgi:hypothetical protein